VTTIIFHVDDAPTSGRARTSTTCDDVGDAIARANPSLECARSRQ
jgi:hypothetical protein